MKKKLLLFSIIVSMAALVGTGSLAYRVVTREFRSVLRTGNVDLKIHQTDLSGEDVQEQPFSIIPGDDVERVVTVENIGTQDLFLRVKVEEHMDGQVSFAQPYITYGVNDAYWEELDGYFYYKEVLKIGESTEPLFVDNNLHIDGFGTPKESLGKSFFLDIKAFGVQVKNNGASPLEAEGWPEDVNGGESR